MPDTRGHIELERTIDSITVGIRHRKDLGDIDALAHSIEEVGLLQPLRSPLAGCSCVDSDAWRPCDGSAGTPCGCGSAPASRTQLSHLLAQQDENHQRKPLTQLEAAHLYAEVKRLMAEEAEERQATSRFGSERFRAESTVQRAPRHREARVTPGSRPPI